MLRLPSPERELRPHRSSASTPPVLTSVLTALIVNLFCPVTLFLKRIHPDEVTAVARQSLQIDANVSGVLVAQLPVFLQGLVDSLFELGRKVGLETHRRVRCAIQDFW